MAIKSRGIWNFKSYHYCFDELTGKSKYAKWDFTKHNHFLRGRYYARYSQQIPLKDPAEIPSGISPDFCFCSSVSDSFENSSNSSYENSLKDCPQFHSEISPGIPVRVFLGIPPGVI